MLKMLKIQVQGFVYLLSNPSQLKHLVIREIRYRHRHYSKQRWIEWQKYNSSRISAALRDHAAEALMLPFNVARKQTISGMVSPLGNSLNVLDVGGRRRSHWRALMENGQLRNNCRPANSFHSRSQKPMAISCGWRRREITFFLK